jgi:hypothetical protein
METYLINESIEKERIQLNFLQSLVHYRFSIILLLVSIFSITNGLQNVSTIDFDLNNFQTKISFFFVIVCLISFFYQRNRLKLISVETNEDVNFLIERIIELAKQKNWSIQSASHNYLILNTKRSFPVSRLFISESGGENIYVFYKSNRILVRSIFDFNKSNGFVLSKGENTQNETSVFLKINTK